MSVQAQYLEWVLEQLAALPALRSNRMFGGIGLYSRDVFFGLIDDDTLFFKTDESNISPYQERKMPKFMPFPDRPETILGYHQVPADVIEDAEILVEWARKAIAVQVSILAAKEARRRRPAADSARAATKRRTARKGKAKPKAARPNAKPKRKSARRAK